ncbi:MAG: hypothetical protein RIQ52_1613 [Pseudomonadota bacterium]
MKKYRAIELELIAPIFKDGRQDVNEADRSKLAALEHRIKKIGGSGGKHLLGEGAVKKVFNTSSGLPAPLWKETDFVLCKINVEPDATDPLGINMAETLTEIFGDVVKTMCLLGQRRTTLYYSNQDKNTGALDINARRFCYYMPRVEGRTLRSITNTLSEDQKILYLTQSFWQLHQLHQARLCHYDFKDANAIVHPTRGSQLIDFGSVSPPWIPAIRTTPAYAMATMGFRSAANQSLTRLNGIDPARYEPGKPFEANFWINYACDRKLSPWRTLLRNHLGSFGRNRSNLTEYRSITDPTTGYKVAMFGIYHDMGCLWQTAVEMGLLTKPRTGLFQTALEHCFKPYYIRQLLDALGRDYTGNPNDLDQKVCESQSPFHLYEQCRDLRVRLRPDNELDPETSARDMTALFRTLKPLSPDEAQLHGECTKVQADGELAFKVLSGIEHIYKAPSLEYGPVTQKQARQEVSDFKRDVMTALIQRLRICWQPYMIQGILTKVFTIALINRSSFYQKHTESEKQIFKSIKSSPAFLEVLRTYWSPEVNETMVMDDFYNLIKQRGEAIYEGAFVKHHGRDQQELILHYIADELGVPGAMSGATDNATSRVTSVKQQLAARKTEVENLMGIEYPLGKLVNDFRKQVPLDSISRSDADQLILQQDSDLLIAAARKGFDSLFSYQSAASIRAYQQDLDELYTQA